MNQEVKFYLESCKFFKLKKEEVEKILFNEFLLSKCSHFLVEKTGITQTRAHGENYIEEILRIQKGYKNDYKTIKVENLEDFNDELFEASKVCGHGTDVHMFISPVRGTAFPEHTDDRDVYIYCIYGNKRFYIEGVPRILSPGDVLYIPAGTKHRAETDGASGILSFGVPVKRSASQTNYFGGFLL